VPKASRNVEIKSGPLALFTKIIIVSFCLLERKQVVKEDFWETKREGEGKRWRKKEAKKERDRERKGGREGGREGGRKEDR
jgi:hypothetical protein